MCPTSLCLTKANNHTLSNISLTNNTIRMPSHSGSNSQLLQEAWNIQAHCHWSIPNSVPTGEENKAVIRTLWSTSTQNVQIKFWHQLTRSHLLCGVQFLIPCQQNSRQNRNTLSLVTKPQPINAMENEDEQSSSIHRHQTWRFLLNPIIVL